MANPLEEFEALLSKFHQHDAPENKEELHQQLSELSELLLIADHVLLYLAMHKEMHDELITFLFEFKQVAKLERYLQGLEYTLPDKAVHAAQAGPVLAKPWWQFWKD